MGLMTGLAIGAALGGGLLAGNKAGSTQRKRQMIQAPPTAPSPTGLKGDIPAPPIVNPGADMATAQGAARGARKRAALGGLSTRPLAKPGQVGARAVPRTLIGY